MTKKIQVVFTDEQWAVIDKLRGMMGESDADLVRNISISWLSEQSMIKPRGNKDGKFYFVDLFSGAGGLSKGLETAGMSCALGVDFDKIAIKTFKRNHPDSEVFAGDISKLTTETLKEIIKDYYPTYTPEDLLAFYMITGGVAKYVELLVEAKAFTLEAILDEIFSDNSRFLDEGKNVLIDEFGKDYGNYF